MCSFKDRSEFFGCMTAFSLFAFKNSVNRLLFGGNADIRFTLGGRSLLLSIGCFVGIDGSGGSCLFRDRTEKLVLDCPSRMIVCECVAELGSLLEPVSAALFLLTRSLLRDLLKLLFGMLSLRLSSRARERESSLRRVLFWLR